MRAAVVVCGSALLCFDIVCVAAVLCLLRVRDVTCLMRVGACCVCWVVIALRDDRCCWFGLFVVVLAGFGCVIVCFELHLFMCS